MIQFIRRRIDYALHNIDRRLLLYSLFAVAAPSSFSSAEVFEGRSRSAVWRTGWPARRWPVASTAWPVLGFRCSFDRVACTLSTTGSPRVPTTGYLNAMTIDSNHAYIKTTTVRTTRTQNHLGLLIRIRIHRICIRTYLSVNTFYRTDCNHNIITLLLRLPDKNKIIIIIDTQTNFTPRVILALRIAHWRWVYCILKETWYVISLVKQSWAKLQCNVSC